MIQFRDIQAINTIQADAAFGLVAAADIDHRASRECVNMSPYSGKRRRMSKWPCPKSTVPVCPGVERGGHGGLLTGPTPHTRPVPTGGPAATLWATLVIQRALSS